MNAAQSANTSAQRECDPDLERLSSNGGAIAIRAALSKVSADGCDIFDP